MDIPSVQETSTRKSSSSSSNFSPTFYDVGSATDFRPHPIDDDDTFVIRPGFWGLPPHYFVPTTRAPDGRIKTPTKPFSPTKIPYPFAEPVLEAPEDDDEKDENDKEKDKDKKKDKIKDNDKENDKKKGKKKD